MVLHVVEVDLLLCLSLFAAGTRGVGGGGEGPVVVYVFVMVFIARRAESQRSEAPFHSWVDGVGLFVVEGISHPRRDADHDGSVVCWASSQLE
jgi:hypothetical protein